MEYLGNLFILMALVVLVALVVIFLGLGAVRLLSVARSFIYSRLGRQ